MNNKVLLPIYLGLALTLGVLIGIYFDFPARHLAFDETNQREQKIRQIIDYIDFEYVDNVNTDSLLDVTISGLLQKLDPHSTYIPVEDVAANEESIRGSFEGIGIEFKIYKDTLAVVRVMEGGPSKRAGLKAGDRILYADEVPLFGEDLNAQKVVQNLKGKTGSNVNLAIYNPQSQTSATRKVRRGEVPLNSVQTYFMADSITGYLKLIRFAETTSREVKGALKELKKQGAENIILDLRDNPGGLLSAARDVSNQFLDKGQLIVFTKDKEGNRTDIEATKKGVYKDGKVVVLINEGSASASEIVAGALQDNDRATVIGRRSFGKGLVQEEMVLNDGSRIRLTTQRYYTPTGRSIQKPYTDYDNGFLRGKGYDEALPEQDSLDDSKKVFTTPAGKRVYGGGGIMPDVLVPIDTSRSAAVLYHLSMMVNLDERAFSYVDNHRGELDELGKRGFIEEFEVNDDDLSYFLGQAYDRVTKIATPESLELVKTRIKSFIAYNLYGNSAFVEVYFPKDPISTKAKEALAEEGE